MTFPRQFGSDRRLQDRLAQLTQAGLLHRFRYAVTEGSGQFYHTLSPESFRLLHGQDVPLPGPGLFREVGISRQHHTKSLADFVVRTFVAVHERQVPVGQFTRENVLKLSIGQEHLYPDGSFTLTLPDRPPFLYYVELDNSTEPLTSPSERDSWIKKLRLLRGTPEQHFHAVPCTRAHHTKPEAGGQHRCPGCIRCDQSATIPLLRRVPA